MNRDFGATRLDGASERRRATTMIDPTILFGVFLTAFVAATILPAQSETALVAAIVAGGQDPVVAVAVASIGNVGGAVVNWWLGREVRRFGSRRWFPVSAADLERASGWYERYGKWSLLLSWAPFVGDPLTVVAGFLRERLSVFLLLVGIAKIGRYAVLAAATLAWPT